MGMWDRFFTALASAKRATAEASREIVTRLGLSGVLIVITGVASDGVNEQQVVTIDADGGTFILTYDGEATDAIAYDASAATVQTALRANANIGATDVTVAGSAGGPWTVTFAVALAATDVPLMEIDDTSLTKDGLAVVATVTAGTHTAAEADTQSIKVKASGGTFTLTYDGQTTAAIAYNATAAAVQTALEALSNIAASGADVTVSGGPGDINESWPYVVTFVAGGALAAADLALTGNGGSLTGTGHALTMGQLLVGITAPTAVNEIESVTLTATGGTFKLTYSTQETAAIDFDASAADVQAALEALSNVVAGDVIVSGPDGGPYLIEFSGLLRYTNVSEITVSDNSLTDDIGESTVEETVKGEVAGTALGFKVQVPDGDGGWIDYVDKSAVLADDGSYPVLIHPTASAAPAGGAKVNVACPTEFRILPVQVGVWTYTISGQYVA